jgi:hypothetical protein
VPGPDLIDDLDSIQMGQAVPGDHLLDARTAHRIDASQYTLVERDHTETNASCAPFVDPGTLPPLQNTLSRAVTPRHAREFLHDEIEQFVAIGHVITDIFVPPVYSTGRHVGAQGRQLDAQHHAPCRALAANEIPTLGPPPPERLSN